MRANTLGYRIPLFPRDVFAQRRERVAAAVRHAGLDVLLVTIPENIYYLIGLDHFGYFAFHMVVIPASGEPILVARKMEHVTIGRDVPDLRFVGYGDNDDLPRHCIDVIESVAPDPDRIGMEETSLFLIPTVALGVRDHFQGAEVVDATEITTSHRLVQSHEELEVTRQAAVVSDAMMEAAIATARVGVTERDVAAAAVAAMMEAGGEPPAFWPFVRCAGRLNEDHTTWTDYPLRAGDAVFLELSGCIGRYHAPMGRIVFVDSAPEGAETVAKVCLDAFEAARLAAKPGMEAGTVYEAWQEVLDGSGFAYYRRHHCGYATGIGFPPSWSGNGVPRALRPGSQSVLSEGMVFHLMSWMMGTGSGDYFVSDPVVIGRDGGRRLTKSGQELVVV